MNQPYMQDVFTVWDEASLRSLPPPITFILKTLLAICLQTKCQNEAEVSPKIIYFLAKEGNKPVCVFIFKEF